MAGMSLVRMARALSFCLSAVTLTVAPLMVPASAGASRLLRVLSTEVATSQASVVVAVPPELANLVLPASAFAIRAGGRLLPVAVQRVSAAGLDVHVVLDTNAANTALVAQQSAAADLLRRLPATVRTSVVTSAGAAPVPELGNVAALRAVAVAKHGPAMAVDKTLNRIAAAAVDGRRHIIVLMTSCPEDSKTDLNRLRRALDSGSSQLDIIRFGKACNSRLLSLAHDGGGLTLVPLGFNQLAEAADTIAYDILCQYRLSVPVPVPETPMLVTFDFAGIHAVTELRLPVAAADPASSLLPRPRSLAPAAIAPADGSGESRMRVVLAVLAGLILIAVAACELRVIAARVVLSGFEPADPVVPLAPVAAPASAPGDRPPATRPDPSCGAPQSYGLGLPVAGLSDGSIRVRVPRRDDAPALCRFAESEGGLAGAWAPLPEHPNLADCETALDSWSRAWSAEHTTGRLGLAVERGSEGETVGYVGLLVKPHTIEVMYGTAPPYRGQGYAKRAVRLVAQWLAQQQPLTQVEAVIQPSDNLSRRVARDVGFVPDGTVRTFIPATGMVVLSLRFVFRPSGDG